MIRIGFTEIALFAAPFVLYAVFLGATKAGVLDAESWPLSRLAWLAIAALLLVVGSFIYFAHFTGAPPVSPVTLITPAMACNVRSKPPSCERGPSWPKADIETTMMPGFSFASDR